MKAVYFASVRERLGKAEEEIAPPAQVLTVADLIAWLTSRDEVYAAAFASTVRAALDRVHVKPETPLGPAREVAFFPPMTGG